MLIHSPYYPSCQAPMLINGRFFLDVCAWRFVLSIRGLVHITNTDDGIIGQTEQTISVKFDEINTTEQAGAYKPSHKGFLLARERIGLDVSEIWHYETSLS